MYEVNWERLIKRFVDLVKIPSPSWDEGGVISYIIDVLEDLGIYYEKHKCNDSYNLLARLDGKDNMGLPILFVCHMDTVTPCENVKPIITATKISSDGTTILGADDKAAIASFLEALHFIKESKIPHGRIEFLFSCAEEVGLQGIKGFDLSLLDAKYAFVFDSDGEIGGITLKAPFHITMEVAIRGKSSHAGVEPEKGVSAIRVLAEIISRMPHGRIDEETTVNVGSISGGGATNIVAESAKFNLEARSINRSRLRSLESEIRDIIMDVSRGYRAKANIERRVDYSGFSIKENEGIVKIVNTAIEKIGLKPEYRTSGGGSDTNIINKAGIKAVNLSIGMKNAHTKKEYILIKNIQRGAMLVLSIIESVNKNPHSI
ncbi:MAG: M20/M25/M40 family metallo-hydrolase [Spirochaetota bacterium]|nr:M20/M25/M40 family metallo-hydrolase [Spirochaetota bacterium]